MPVLDRHDLHQVPTIPDNLSQPPRFGAITETVKDAFVLELRQYFETKYDRMRLGELPRIDKYSVRGAVSSDPLETAVSLIRSYPDLTEDLPAIAITSTTGRNLKLDISNKYISSIIDYAKVSGTTIGPRYALADGMDIELTSLPDGKTVQQSRFVFKSFMFTNISQATIEEIVACINFQALYVTAYVARSGTDKMLGIKGGGPHANIFPNTVTITGGTALSVLGLTASQTNTNFGAGKQAYERYSTSAELTVGIEIFTPSENVRTDLTDLVYDFFTYVMQDRKFQFYGRSIFDETILNEVYQIILRDSEFSFGGDNEVPRPGDKKDKIYISRLSIPVIAIQCSDRIITNMNGTPAAPAVSIQLIDNFEFPDPN